MTSSRLSVTQFLYRNVTLWITLQLAVRSCNVTASQSIVFYQKANQCPDKVLTTDLTSGNFSVRSKVQCAAMCVPNLSCHSFLYDPENKNCYLGSQPSDPTCTNMVAAEGLQHYDMKTACRNGGVLTVEGVCVCPRGYIGPNCDIIMRDCHVGYTKGKVKSGVYWILPKLAAEPFQVNCRMVDRPRTYIFDRIDNDVNFTRMWDDYKAGFGNAKGDYWVGLDNLHVLTNSQKYELRFRVRLRTNTNLFQHYDKFRVGDEASNYRITFSREVDNGSLGDCLSPANGASFSTMDRDNDDNVDVHCAQRHQAGFWFAGKNCTRCNPTGRLLQPENQTRFGIPEEVFWTESLGDIVPYKVSAYLVNAIK